MALTSSELDLPRQKIKADCQAHHSTAEIYDLPVSRTKFPLESFMAGCPPEKKLRAAEREIHAKDAKTQEKDCIETQLFLFR